MQRKERMTVPENCEGERTNNGDFSPSDSIQSSEWGLVAFETQKARLFIGNDDEHTKPEILCMLNNLVGDPVKLV